MGTEDISARYLDLDLWGTEQGVRALHEGQVEAVAAVGPAIPAIAAAVDAAVPGLKRGGRLIYVGAGTSARIGVQDGAELFPTFSWPREQVAFAIAGGEECQRQEQGGKDAHGLKIGSDSGECGKPGMKTPAGEGGRFLISRREADQAATTPSCGSRST